MLTNKKTSSQLTREREEQELRELHKIFLGGDAKDKAKAKDPTGAKVDDADSSSQPPLAGAGQAGRVLKIYRTFKNAEGKEYTRVELVRKPAIIDTYVRIRQTKDEAFIKQFATPDEHQKVLGVFWLRTRRRTKRSDVGVGGDEAREAAHPGAAAAAQAQPGEGEARHRQQPPAKGQDEARPQDEVRRLRTGQSAFPPFHPSGHVPCARLELD